MTDTGSLENGQYQLPERMSGYRVLDSAGQLAEHQEIKSLIYSDAISEMTEKLYSPAISNCSYRVLEIWPHGVYYALES